MGSTGSGRFSDYPGTGGTGSGGAGDGGGPAGEDRCTRAFNVTVQDVEHGEYHTNRSTVPPVGTELSIELRKRLVAVDASGESVGNLPTSFNYIADCLSSGFSYAGVVSASSDGPTATVIADFAPES